MCAINSLTSDLNADRGNAQHKRRGIYRRNLALALTYDTGIMYWVVATDRDYTDYTG